MAIRACLPPVDVSVTVAVHDLVVRGGQNGRTSATRRVVFAAAVGRISAGAPLAFAARAGRVWIVAPGQRHAGARERRGRRARPSGTG